jgi:flagella basal body P-ring formation protein FlgA
MMMIRPLLLAAALLAALAGSAAAQSEPADPAIPALRAAVTVSADVVRIGDLVENAGSTAQIAIFRAPDLGTTGTLPVSQLMQALRAHHVIGVNTRDLREVSVTRASRTLGTREVEVQIARALERRNGLGDAANLAITFEQGSLRDLQLDAAYRGEMRPAIVRFDPRNGRFDVTFEIVNDVTAEPTRLRFIGIALETVETAVVTRNVERNEVLRASDVVTERKPKAEVGNDGMARERAVGMQARKSMRTGQAVKAADLGKPDLVTRDQSVTVIYEAPGLYLTGRGKALDSGTEGDVVNIVNLQSKRTIQAVVIGPGQVAAMVATPRAVTTTAALAAPAAPGGAETAKAE